MGNRLEAWFREEAENAGLYFGMARRAEEEGDPEIASELRSIAAEKIENAGALAELAGKVGSTLDNLKAMLDSEEETARNLRDEAKNSTEGNKVRFLKIAEDKDRHAGALKGVINRMS